MSKEYIVLASRIREILDKSEESRDDDRILISSIWIEQCLKKNTENFLYEFISGGISSPESIRRIRQKLQEKCPELRGNKYQERQKMRGMFYKNIESCVNA